MTKRTPGQLRIETSGDALDLPLRRGDIGIPLTAVLRGRGLPLNTRCGGRGLCQGCLITLKQGVLTHLATGASVGPGGGFISACQHTLPAGAPAEIAIPDRSLLAHEAEVIDEFRINVPRAHDPLIAPNPGDLGVAIDVGTTTVAVLIVDLMSGEVVGRAAGFNRQIHVADDVVSRITLCMSDPGALERFQHAVAAETIAPLVRTATGETGLARVRCLTVAGNTTMLHLLSGADPSSLGVAPFTPGFLEHRELSAQGLGFGLPADAPVHLLPGAAAYIGADLTAGMAATGLAYERGPAMLVDVGTNGEIILKHDDVLLGCATAAGPAFEGAGLTSGVRATRGAISHIRLAGEPPLPDIETIGGARPTGICGSAYIDFLAEAREVGLLTDRGRFRDEPPESFRRRVSAGQSCYGRQMRLATRGGTAIGVTEADVAALLQAKAAIAAGILTLLRRADLAPAEVRTLHLAGGFGLNVSVNSAIRCGLLPGFVPEQIQPVGNSSLAGAYLALLDRSVLEDMRRTAARVRTIELNLDPDFETTYIEQMVLE